MTKTCKQCGELKPLTQFRNYYGGRKGTYTICKSCERINSRAKYLEKKGTNKSIEEQLELDKIYKLYSAQRSCGLQPPRQEGGRSTKLVDDLDDMISKYSARANEVVDPQDVMKETPAEVLKWLAEPLTEDPEYYLDEVYEALREKYRPVLRIDQATMTPVYDDRFATALDAVLARFNAYEDEYYTKEDE